MDVKEFKKRCLRGYIHRPLFYLPTEKKEDVVGYGNIYIRQMLYTSYDIATGSEIKEKGTIYNYCAQWVLLNSKNEVVYNDKSANTYRYYYRQNDLPAGTYTFKILATLFKPINGYEQKIKIKPNETTNFDVLFGFMVSMVKKEKTSYNPYDTAHHYYSYSSGRSLAKVEWGNYISYGCKVTFKINNEFIQDTYVVPTARQANYKSGVYEQNPVTGGYYTLAYSPNVIVYDGGGSFPTEFSWENDADLFDDDYSNEDYRVCKGSSNAVFSSEGKFRTSYTIKGECEVERSKTDTTIVSYKFEKSAVFGLDVNNEDKIYWYSLEPTEWWNLNDSNNYIAWQSAGNKYFTEHRWVEDEHISVGNQLWMLQWQPEGINELSSSDIGLLNREDPSLRISAPVKRIINEGDNFYVQEIHRIAPVALRFHKATESNYLTFRAIPFLNYSSTWPFSKMNPYAVFYDNGQALNSGRKTSGITYKDTDDEFVQYWAFSYTYFSDDYEKY